MKSRQVLFIIDPPEKLDPPTDTSLALMRECRSRNYQVFWCALAGLRLERGIPRATAAETIFEPGRELFVAGERRDLDLTRVAMVFMRKDPPVDLAYLHATYILDRLPPAVLQINPASALRSDCEKLIPSLFPDLAPETLVSCDPQQIRDFLAAQGHIVIKPLEDCSGHGIYALRPDDPNAKALIGAMTEGGRRFLQAQRYLPAIAEGDKRVLLLDGEILGWVRRVPPQGDFRSNVNAGGRCELCELTESDRRICAEVRPWLQREGIWLAGIDIVGEHVLEVNITSPSCLREINDLTTQRLEARIVDRLEQELARQEKA